MRFLVAFVTIVVSVSLVVGLLAQSLTIKNEESKPVYVGVAFQGDTIAEAKLLIDRVKDYTNLFVLGATPVSRDEAATNEVCEYAIANGLDLMVNFGYNDPHASSPDNSWRRWHWQLDWLGIATQKWGNRFLGVYYDDEPGGMQLDYDWSGFFQNYLSYFQLPGDWSLKGVYDKLHEANATGSPPSDYDLEAYYFVNDLLKENIGLKKLSERGIMTITSDYSLYWFDCLGGYDVMLAQFGWNHSIVQDIALAKGAARLQNKPWGAIVTWKYDKLPYLDSGENIYEQMTDAYQAGASYITIFNYPKVEGNDYGVMQDEHFAALERFWNTVVKPNFGRARKLSSADAALVLPRNYGWGMRSSDDRIWGMWGTDDKSSQIWEISRRLLAEYGVRLDIVYDDPAFPVAGRYNRVYYWNESA
jgi:hypothetical protein